MRSPVRIVRKLVRWIFLAGVGVGVMEEWDVGILEWWNNGIVECLPEPAGGGVENTSCKDCAEACAMDIPCRC